MLACGRDSAIVSQLKTAVRDTMSDNTTFQELLRRIRAGEPDAAVELVRQFEPIIRVEIRRRLQDPYLHRVFDSCDVCQSVLASFFLRASAGQYQLHEPQDLVKLLLSMARKKVASRARRERTQSRDHRRVASDPNVLENVAGGPTPDRLVASQELFQKCHALLSDEERRLMELRAQGRTWPEVAAEVGGQAQARRRQLERALDRVARQLGLEDDNE
jgi:RNA polymerase sigma-70 factor (ECF subfamily)